ncbi:MAG: cytochrome c [Novosphingobium sp.]|nr:cytochrome c [Novosphingobium sp.]
MRRWIRWSAYTAATVLTLALAAAAAITIASQHLLARKYPVRPERLVRAPAPAVADAPRQARLLGCLSCHGDGLRGNRMFDEAGLGFIVAPNLPRLIRKRSDQQIAAAIRQGVGPDGRPLLVMPSALFSRLTDAQVSALIAWMRGLPAGGAPNLQRRLSLLGRITVLNGDMPRQPELLPLYRERMPPDLSPEHAPGHYIAATVCAECHGPDLSGGDRPHADFNSSWINPTPPAPDLAIAAAYDLAAFTRLMRTGVAPGERRLGMMSEVARDDLRLLTDAEIDALHRYLQARAAPRADP